MPLPQLLILSQQLASSDKYLGRTRVVIKPGKLVQLDIAPDQAAVLEPEDVNLRSLDALIRTRVLDRDLGAVFPDESFWRHRLQHVDQIVSDAISGYEGSPAGEERFKKAMLSVEGEFRSLQTDVLMQMKKKQLDTDLSRERVPGYKVAISIDPPKARVRYMPFLSFLLYRSARGSLDDHWTDLSAGTRYLIGKYHYVADWPAELHGTVEGNFEVREDSAITFMPISK